jgi:hypothetical protein
VQLPEPPLQLPEPPLVSRRQTHCRQRFHQCSHHYSSRAFLFFSCYFQTRELGLITFQRLADRSEGKEKEENTNGLFPTGRLWD